MKFLQIAAIAAALSALTFGCQKKAEKKASYPPTPATLVKEPFPLCTASTLYRKFPDRLSK